MPQIVPLQAVPSQTTQIVLASQNCQINVYQSPVALFIDLFVNDEPVRVGIIAQNLNLIVREAYLGFSGDFVFQDTQGSSDPIFSGLGSRFQLLYLAAADLASAG
jgi:hypothetical protein